MLVNSLFCLRVRACMAWQNSTGVYVMQSTNNLQITKHVHAVIIHKKKENKT